MGADMGERIAPFVSGRRMDYIESGTKVARAGAGAGGFPARAGGSHCSRRIGRLGGTVESFPSVHDVDLPADLPRLHGLLPGV